MTKIKLCGLTRPCDIVAANHLRPEYIGFVFVPQSRRCISAAQAAQLKKMLCADITAVGVFVNEKPERIAELLADGVIDAAQLHGQENEEYIEFLKLTGKPVIKTFCLSDRQDVAAAQKSRADYLLFDSGAGTGKVFDWTWIKEIKRPYFLAGGLHSGNVSDAVCRLHPYAVDVSSGIETNGLKDQKKMTEFVDSVRKEKRI